MFSGSKNAYFKPPSQTLTLFSDLAEDNEDDGVDETPQGY